MNRLIVPPLPAASLPSKSTTIFWPESFTQRCALRSSTCSRAFSRSYARRFILVSYGYSMMAS